MRLVYLAAAAALGALAATVPTAAQADVSAEYLQTVYVVGYRDFCDGHVDVGLANPAQAGTDPITFQVNGVAVTVAPQATVWHTVADKPGTNPVKVKITAVDAVAKVSDGLKHSWTMPATCTSPSLSPSASLSPSPSSSPKGGTAGSPTATASADGSGSAAGGLASPTDPAAAASSGAAIQAGGVSAASLPALPVTGPDNIAAIVGIMLLTGGAVTLAVARRRRRIRFRA